MENITNTVKEKMQKTYSFTGTQLLVTGLGVIILLGIFACAGRHGGPKGMMNHDMMRGDRGQMMQQYDRQWMNWQQKQGILPDGRQVMRWQSNNQGKYQQPMMNSAASAEQPTLPSAPTGTGN